jgi:hypothetical protein
MAEFLDGLQGMMRDKYLSTLLSETLYEALSWFRKQCY